MKLHHRLWKEAMSAILPMAAVILFLLLTLVRIPHQELIRFIIGVGFVLIGMFFFLLGAETGLTELGRLLGSALPTRGSAPFFVFSAFLLGVIVTVAEPDVRVLAGQFAELSAGLIGKGLLIGCVAVGVGLFVALAMLRIVRGTPIRWVLTGGYLLVLALALITPPSYLPLSFDAGGVTTGPMTVPFILSLGAGTSAVMQGRSVLADGFGLVGLASLGPIMAVMILGIIWG